MNCPNLFRISVGDGENDLYPKPTTATFTFIVEITFRITYQGMSEREGQVESMIMGDSGSFTLVMDGFETTCPADWVNPCDNKNGGCSSEPFVECKPLGCSAEVVCGKCPGAVDRDGNCVTAEADEDNSTLIAALAAGGAGLLAAGIIAFVVMKKKKSPVTDTADGLVDPNDGSQLETMGSSNL